MIVSPEKS